MSILNEWLPTGTIKAHWWQMETQLSRINGIRNFMFNFVWVWLKRDYAKYIYLWCKNTLIVYYIIWRSGRVVYSRSLENFRSSNGAVGSNPAFSAEYTNFKKNLLYLLRFCYVFVCFKDSHRNNKKLKQIIWLLSFESCFILTNITDKWILWCDKEVVYLRHEMISNGGRGRLFFIKVVQ